MRWVIRVKTKLKDVGGKSSSRANYIYMMEEEFLKSYWLSDMQGQEGSGSGEWEIWSETDYEEVVRKVK